jgi:predicted nucleotidyltransferase
MKDFLGIGSSDTSEDTFLQLQISIVSDAIEGYCNRKFLEKNYIQYFFKIDFDCPVKKIFLQNYPLKVLASLSESDSENSSNWASVTNFRFHNPSGTISSFDSFFRSGSVIKVEYTAGYSELPPLIKGVIFSLVKERYSKKKNNIDLEFGADVQRISIPGAIAIDFDYTLSHNERKSTFGVILGNYLNVLDAFRSERVFGSSKLSYVEEV